MSAPLRRSAALLLPLAAVALVAADWPRFRGPNGTGATPDTAPVKFDPKTDVKWKTAIPGGGHSSPIVVGGKVYLQSAAADGSKQFLLCLSAATGKIEWTADAEADKPTQLHKKNTPASGTPCCDGERVYASFWDGQAVTLSAYDLKGKFAWKQRLGSFASQHGAGHSPVAYNGVVYFNFDQDGSAELFAFDAKTGEKKWTATRKAHRASYTTPFVLEEAGKDPQLVVASTTTVDGYAPDTGKVNWTYTLDWKTPKKLRAIGQPILAAGNVLVTTGDGDGSRYAVAVKADGTGDTSKTGKAWEATKGTPYVPGVLAYKDALYFVSDDGQVGCLDAKTGKEKWTERAFSKAVSSSPVLVGDVVLGISEDGKVVAFKAQPTEFERVGEASLGEPVFASPAVSDGHLFVRGGTHLFCIGK